MLTRPSASSPASATSATVRLNGKAVQVTWPDAAERALAARTRPLVLELELHFSCLVKKSVQVHDDPAGRATVPVTDRLHLCFRAVTSVACSMDEAERLGAQPRTEIDTPVARRLAPSRVLLDHAGGRWQGEFWI